MLDLHCVKRFFGLIILLSASSNHQRFPFFSLNLTYLPISFKKVNRKFSAVFSRTWQIAFAISNIFFLNCKKMSKSLSKILIQTKFIFSKIGRFTKKISYFLPLSRATATFYEHLFFTIPLHQSYTRKLFKCNKYFKGNIKEEKL